LFGVLYVDNMEKAEAFSQEEMNVFAVIATQAAAAIDNAMSHQKIAHQAVQQKALERFLAPEVVAMVARDPHGIRLGGANQKVTVMFADIRGFTSLAEKMAPEQVVEILNEYFTRVTEIIFDHSGTLDKYLGDGVMAIFGAPFTKGNDALNAVKAATTIQRMVKQLNRDAADRRWPELHVGIGVNTGVVTAGNIGSPRRLDYTVVGDAVNVAARLMASAEKDQILISDTTKAELPSGSAVTALPPLKVKGKAEPLKVYSLERRPTTAKAATRRL
jgi:adenylate cyclase